jgi:hypothetical protein
MQLVFLEGQLLAALFFRALALAFRELPLQFGNAPGIWNRTGRTGQDFYYRGRLFIIRCATSQPKAASKAQKKSTG